MCQISQIVLKPLCLKPPPSVKCLSNTGLFLIRFFLKTNEMFQVWWMISLVHQNTNRFPAKVNSHFRCRLSRLQHCCQKIQYSNFPYFLLLCSHNKILSLFSTVILFQRASFIVGLPIISLFQTSTTQ